MKVAVVFDIVSFWHAGTGKGAGPDMDALVFRTPAGLPCLPGRTVKGLLRDAWRTAAAVGAVSADVAREEHLFGSRITERTGEERERALEAMRLTSRPGTLRFGSALLGESDEAAERWEAWAARAESAPARAALTRSFASTRIASDGVVADGALRSIEVAVPMKLRALVEGPEGDWPRELEQAVVFVDGVGSHRSRGLGRVNVSVGEAR